MLWSVGVLGVLGVERGRLLGGDCAGAKVFVDDVDALEQGLTALARLVDSPTAATSVTCASADVRWCSRRADPRVTAPHRAAGTTVITGLRLWPRWCRI